LKNGSWPSGVIASANGAIATTYSADEPERLRGPQRQERFVKEYLIEPNATKAAIRAGYSTKTAEAIGHENLRKPKISEKLEKARAERAERCALSCRLPGQEPDR
jgi:phage terminase large subunit-like protein